MKKISISKIKKEDFKFRKSIFTKIFFLIFFIILFFGIIAIFVVYFASFDSMIKSEKNHILASNNLYSKIIEQRFKNAENVVKEIANRKEIIDHFIIEHNHISHIENSPITLYLEHYNVAEDFDAIYLMDKNGLVVSSTEPTFLNQNYSFREYFKKIKEGKNIYIDSFIGVTSNKLGYYISSPILDKNNNILAVVVCKIKSESIHKNISEVADTVQYQAISMFVDKYGVILYSDANDRVYKSLNRLPDNLIESFSNTKRFNNIKIDYLSYEKPSEIVNSNFNGSIIIDLYDKKDNEKEIVTISSIGNYPFYLISEIKTEYFVENSIKIASILALSVLASVISAIFFIYIIIRKILKPLDYLKKIANSISLGNYDFNIDIKSKDEFGALANSINKMSKSIKQYRDNIQKKVDEKTRRINKLNSFMVGRELKMIELKKRLKELKDKYEIKE